MDLISFFGGMIIGLVFGFLIGFTIRGWINHYIYEGEDNGVRKHI